MLPAVDSLLLHAEPALLATLAALICQRPASLPLLVLGTCAAPLDELPPQLQAERRALQPYPTPTPTPNPNPTPSPSPNQAELRALFPLDHFELAPPPRPRREALLRTFFDDARVGVPQQAPPAAAPAAPLRKAPPPPKLRPSEREVRSP